MKKYIIKNCPSIHAGWRTMYECFYYNKPCTDCTDCLFKQIVEKCKKAESAYFASGNTDMFISGRSNLAGNILAMLEIQECE